MVVQRSVTVVLKLRERGAKSACRWCCRSEIYIKHTNPSTDTETVMVCLAIFTAVAFFLEYHQNSLLNEAQFVIDLNNQFLNEGKLANVEHDLEMYYNAVRTGKNTLKI